ncbi:hypothetical protein HMPREF0063_12586 [Aeromicrobium marinum DSM 15272]|uniref:Microcin J25-processing protein McjB C-terminal domain-containing protein n=1 Tax=Aeromicrobium marinum DSM 15272 TaxID=585531 RepID=E2SEX7_9ACTN|nr:hypothetical protein HMPREF0063_12586 [Aeromicrobium marinum DSM 15272]
MEHGPATGFRVRRVRSALVAGPLAVVAWVLLALARVAIALLPFGLVRRLLGEDGLGDDGGGAPSTARPERARRVAGAIARAVRSSPWRADCYPQAIAARLMLVPARVPHTLVFGVRRDTAGALLAHVWVEAGDVRVAGGRGAGFVPVGSFSWVPGRAGRRSPRADVQLLRDHGR